VGVDVIMCDVLPIEFFDIQFLLLYLLLGGVLAHDLE
jgi:hypothetical protein